MKLPVAPIQRAVLAVAGAALVAASVSVVALATQPASSNADGYETSMTLVEPASDEPTTTTTEGATLVTMAQQVLDAPERAEKAAERAEGAATRAEVAAVHVDQVAATPTTVAPTTSTTTGRPILIGTILPMEPTVTTSTPTTVPKSWVVVARFPVAEANEARVAPLTADVELQTGRLRVSGLPYQGALTQRGVDAVWLGTGPTPAGCMVSIDQKSDGTPIDASDCWPTEPTTISAGSQYSVPIDDHQETRWGAPYGYPTNEAGEIIVEEYR